MECECAQVGQLTIKTKERNIRRQSTREILSRGPKDKGREQLQPEKIDEAYNALTRFNREYFGHIIPPRPTEAQVKDLATPSGSLNVYQGVVLQKGPFDGIFIRAGCVPKTPWHRLWETCKAYVSHFLKQQKDQLKADVAEGNPPSTKGVYVVVSQGSMQAIDFKWLSQQGFKFHHYRPPGHGAVPRLDETEIAAGHPDGDEHATSEFVYYCWPGKPEDDKVPGYATSVEGSSGLLLSTDESKIMLVWERGNWQTPSGAVDPGEGKLAALEREMREEVNVTLDLSWPPHFVGGYQHSRARDNMVNDNFTAFLAKVASDEFTADMAEIKLAAWFDWRDLLQKWEASGSPKSTRVELDMGHEGKTKVRYNCIKWLKRWADGQSIPVQYEEWDKQMGERAGKMDI